MTLPTDRSMTSTDRAPEREPPGTDASSREESSQHEDQDARGVLSRDLAQLSADQWRQLGLSQRYHQHLLSVFCELTALGLEEVSSQRLIEVALDRLEGPERTLFELTAQAAVDQLTLHAWLSEDHSTLTLDPRRARELERVVSRDVDDEVVITLDVFTSAESAPINPSVDRDAEPDGASALEAQSGATPKPQYIDPLEHISHQSESPFTIRRLNQLINSLDGGVLSSDQVSALLKLDAQESELIFDATQRLGLIREDGGYLKLDFLGGRIARQPREERLKTLAHMASRLRQELKQRANS